MSPAAKKKADTSSAEQLASELAAAGIADLVKTAEEVTDREVACVSTGLPQLDQALHPEKLGLPRGRDIEIFSKVESVGKTSLALTIIAAWQAQGLRTMFIDHENTMDETYLNSCGIITRNEEAQENLVPMYWVKHPEPGMPLPAENVFDVIRKAANIMDLIVIDSVASMEQEKNLEKDAGDPNQVGGIAKMISEFCRKNISKRATILWLNQTRQKVGGFNPTGNIQYVTTGGRALPFYSTCRISLTRTEKLKAGASKDEFLGFRVQALLEKNKIAPPWRKATLTYLFGYGFSPHFDYFDLALKQGVVQKKGGWFSFDGSSYQGQVSFVNALREDPELFTKLRQAVDGVEPAKAGQEEVF